MVIGADGVNSFVARAVRAPEYDVGLLRPVATTRTSAVSDRTISSCTSGITTPLVARRRTMVSIW